MRQPRLCGGLSLAACFLLACGSPPRPSDTDLYVMVLEATRREADLPDELAIHPRLALWGSRVELYAPLTDFNAFDTTSVPAIIESYSSYRMCTPTAAGTCRENVAVVLSELRDVGENSTAVRIVLTDRRIGQHVQRHYFARIATVLTGWSVVEFRELPKGPN